eukprot:6177373-Pleurochrysis_carterae.AAC.2
MRVDVPCASAVHDKRYAFPAISAPRVAACVSPFAPNQECACACRRSTSGGAGAQERGIRRGSGRDVCVIDTNARVDFRHKGCGQDASHCHRNAIRVHRPRDESEDDIVYPSVARDEGAQR